MALAFLCCHYIFDWYVICLTLSFNTIYVYFRVSLIFLRHCREDLYFHNLALGETWKHKSQQIFPAHKTMFFLVPETNLLSETTCLKLMVCFSGPTGIYLQEFSNTNSWIKCKICSKFTIETPDVVLEYINVGWNTLLL